MTQLALEPPPTVPEYRVRVLAGIVAGFAWPGRGSFDALPRSLQAAATDAARGALERVAAEPAPSRQPTVPVS